MKAKDTAMSRQELWKINNAAPPEAKYGDVFQVIAEAQAEISFKAGIKRVGEWLDSQKEFISYHYFKFKVHDSELKALLQGEIPNPKKEA